MNRRHFLKSVLLASLAQPRALRASGQRQREMHADVVIIGGGLGGCAAALAVARAGYRAIMSEETDWIGGQLTQQAVPLDEHRWIEKFGATRTYRELRERLRDYYRRHYPLTPAARSRKLLNSGNGLVSRLLVEPRVAVAVLEAMLAPYVQEPRRHPYHRRLLRAAPRRMEHWRIRRRAGCILSDT